MKPFLATRTGQAAAAAAVALLVIAAVVALVLGTGHSSAKKTASAGPGIVIHVSNLRGAAAGQVSVHGVLADARGQEIQQGILTIQRTTTIRPLPAKARILALSVADCARVQIATAPRRHHGKQKAAKKRFKTDCGVFTNASSLQPIKLQPAADTQTVNVGLYCVRAARRLDCSASRISVQPQSK